LLVPLLDAKRGELYAGYYRAGPSGGVESIAPEVALGPEALLERLEALEWSGPGPLGFGQGWSAYGHILGPALLPLPAGPETPSAAAVGQLAAPALFGAAFDLDRLSALEPHYVRPSEAELRFPHGLGL
jgi:tRNA threonylcarbamoyladenosine biosynthesis protein TsaB